jgi:lipopolysaccharide/colanic/teichoic acid biosynthesis glycosyltransferase
MNTLTLPASIELNGVPRIAFRENRRYRVRQRVFDLSVATIVLLIIAPVLLLAMLAIWFEDRGLVIFAQRRVGRFGKLFTIYKLRTMRRTECRDALSPSAKGDSRITRVGYWLRKTSIDEFPQFVNVLLGDMAVVGPRPEMPFIVREYEPWQHLRHLTKPGITGLWQITCRSRIPLHHPDATKIDLAYIQTASIDTDQEIVRNTFRALLSTQGAY